VQQGIHRVAVPEENGWRMYVQSSPCGAERQALSALRCASAIGFQRVCEVKVGNSAWNRQEENAGQENLPGPPNHAKSIFLPGIFLLMRGCGEGLPTLTSYPGPKTALKKIQFGYKAGRRP